MILNWKTFLLILFTFMVVNGLDLKEKRSTVTHYDKVTQSHHIQTRDIFSYYWHSKDAKNKVFLQKLLRELLLKIEEKKQTQIDIKDELERKIFNQYLSSRVTGSFSNDLLTSRY